MRVREERALWGLSYVLLALELYDILITRWGLSLGLGEINGLAMRLMSYGFEFLALVKLGAAYLFIVFATLLFYKGLERRSVFLRKVGYYSMLAAVVFMFIVCLRNWLLVAGVVL